MTYYAQPNDLIGGWVVTLYDKPMSEHNTTEGECPIADFYDEDHAQNYAMVLNLASDGNLAYRSVERLCDGDCREHHTHYAVKYRPIVLAHEMKVL
jgi:hypothetical protein